MLKIRLRRTGRKGSPFYRIVVAEHTTKTTGKFVDLVGHYNPKSKELNIKADQIKHWLDNGAKPSNRVAKLLIGEGLKHKHVKIHLKPERKSKSDKGDSAPVAQSTPTEATETQAPVETTNEVTETTETPAEVAPVEEVKEESKQEVEAEATQADAQAPEATEVAEENK